LEPEHDKTAADQQRRGAELERQGVAMHGGDVRHDAFGDLSGGVSHGEGHEAGEAEGTADGLHGVLNT
jgi:hypothetical protein